jgi:RNA polymerase sigma-70 factor (ECF subfamily)
MLDGDEAAFAALVTRHHGPLLRIARSYVPSQAVAEEVVQETWLAVLNGLSRFEGRSSLKTWIFTILGNRAKSRGARERRSIPISALDRGGDSDEGDAAVDPDRFTDKGRWARPPDRWDRDTPEQLVISAEARTVLERAIAELPPTQQAVITMRDLEGLGSQEVCNILELSETNQRVLLHRARSKIRRALEIYMTKN